VKVLLIGYGSIGKRHFEILKNLKIVSQIDLVTKQNIEQVKCFKALGDVSELESYDYFVISSETVKHYEQLRYLCSKVKNKRILVEKPLYDKTHEDISLNNIVYTAYNLRFHPVLVQLKKLLEGEKIYYANVFCGQYLPNWRPGRNYQESYSADSKKGGGVLRDLSHELDYTNWLFGKLQKIDAISTKVSDLKIRSDDIFTAVGVTENKVIVNLTMDYLSKHPIRKLIVHTQNLTVEADVINYTIRTSDKAGTLNETVLDSVDRNYTYSKMHEAIIGGGDTLACGFLEGMSVVNTINAVKFKEL